MDIRGAITQTNIAESLSKEKLEEIGKKAHDGYILDLGSRRSWETKLEEWLKLATLAKENKSFPWANSSNVKYPIVATAAMQFSARAYPTLIPSDGQIVHAIVHGKDPQGEKAKRAERVGKFMSWQIMYDMDDWEDEMDRLLITLPVLGCVFKKTYWNKETEKNCSHLVMPQDLIVNYWAKSLETCERKTERMEMSKRVLRERQLGEIFLDIELQKPTQEAHQGIKTDLVQPGSDDDTVPYTILEQHGYLDLDDDGYEEPYVITFEDKSKKVLRIVARFEEKDIKTNEKGKVTRIDAKEYYTKYGFIPNPDGGFYDVGFGLLLGPINESVNSIVNQLIDAGTLSNLQSGFIGKGLRIRMGDARFTPGEWKQVNATGDDLNKQVFPLPVREPSKVLFELLGMLVQSSKELASISEIFVGKMPGQNTPATTTMATIEQGMKVFTAIYKRVYRALNKEFHKLFNLNETYLDPQTYTNVLDDTIGPEDFNDDDYDVCPSADPSATSRQEKLARGQALMEVGGQLGTLDKMKVTERILDAMEEPNWQELINKQPPPPDPKVQEMQMKAQLDQQAAQSKMQIDQMKAQLDQQSAQTKLQMESQMSQMKLAYEAQLNEIKLAKAKIDAGATQSGAATDLKAKQVGHTMDMMHKQEGHQMDMMNKQDDHEMKKKQMAAMPKKTKESK
ncbi:MAG: hypothetical protein NUV80_06450 [Candidatus Berkelbacteria bacterium]|nr:hypothetical protein [Candidatus Berkelbacteria bacterium]